MTHEHAILWIDHQRAELVRLTSDGERMLHIVSRRGPRKLHRKAGEWGSGRAPTDREFYDRVAAALTDARDVLLVGPGLAKLEFAAYLTRHQPEVARKLVGIEALDHPSHAELAARAHAYFTRADRLEGVDLR